MAEFPWYAEYRPGKLGGKPDALTRRSGDLPKEGDERLLQKFQTLLKPENYKKKPLETSAITLLANGEPRPDDDEPPPADENPQTHFETLLEKWYRTDPFPDEVLTLLRTGARRCRVLSLAECLEQGGRLFYRGKL